MIKNIIKFFWPFKYESHKIICYHNMSVKLKKMHLTFFSDFCKKRIYKKYNCIISADAQIGKNVEFPHPLGIVIGAGAIIEDNVKIYQNVTIGRKDKDIFVCPTIKKNSIIYCNSAILGNIIVNEHTIVGENSVVLKDTEKNSVYIGALERRVEK